MSIYEERKKGRRQNSIPVRTAHQLGASFQGGGREGGGGRDSIRL